MANVLESLGLEPITNKDEKIPTGWLYPNGADSRFNNYWGATVFLDPELKPRGPFMFVPGLIYVRSPQPFERQLEERARTERLSRAQAGLQVNAHYIELLLQEAIPDKILLLKHVVAGHMRLDPNSAGISYRRFGFEALVNV